MYSAQGNKVVFVHRSGESNVTATCADAAKAADMLNRARHLNDAKRQYTAAARLIADVENLPAFKWED